jgi:hypothetical protein
MLERLVVQRLVGLLGEFVEGGLREEQLSLLFGRGNRIELRNVQLRADRIRDLLVRIGSPVFPLTAALGYLQLTVDLQGRVTVRLRELVIVLANQYVDPTRISDETWKQFRQAVLRIDQTQRRPRLQLAIRQAPEPLPAATLGDQVAPERTTAGDDNNASMTRSDAEQLAALIARTGGQRSTGWAFLGSNLVELALAYVADRVNIDVQDVVLAFADQGKMRASAAQTTERGYGWIAVAFLEQLRTIEWPLRGHPITQSATDDDPIDTLSSEPDSTAAAVIRKRLQLLGLRLSWIPEGSRVTNRTDWRALREVRNLLWQKRQESDADVIGPMQFELGVYVGGFRDYFRTRVTLSAGNLDCRISQLQYLDMISAALRIGVGQVANLSLVSEEALHGSRELYQLAEAERANAKRGILAANLARSRWLLATRCIRQLVRIKNAPWTRESLTALQIKRRQYLAAYLAANVLMDTTALNMVRLLEQTMDLEQILALRTTAEYLAERFPQKALRCCAERSLATLVTGSSAVQRWRHRFPISWCLWCLHMLWNMFVLMWCQLERRLSWLGRVRRGMQNASGAFSRQAVRCLGRWLLSSPADASSTAITDLDQAAEHVLESLQTHLRTDYQGFLQNRAIPMSAAASTSAESVPSPQPETTMIAPDRHPRPASITLQRTEAFKLEVSLNRVQLTLYRTHECLGPGAATVFGQRSSLLSTVAIEYIGCWLGITRTQDLQLEAWLTRLQLIGENEQLLVRNQWERSTVASDKALLLRLQHPHQGMLDLRMDFAPLYIYLSADILRALLRFWIPETVTHFALQGRRYAARVLHRFQERFVRSADASLLHKLGAMFMRLHFGGMFILFGDNEQDLRVPVTNNEPPLPQPGSETLRGPANSRMLGIRLAGAELVLGDDTALAPHLQRDDNQVLVTISKFDPLLKKAFTRIKLLDPSASFSQPSAGLHREEGPSEISESTDAANHPDNGYNVESRVLFRFPGLELGWYNQASTSHDSEALLSPERSLLQLDTLRVGTTLTSCLVSAGTRPKLLARVLVAIIIERLFVDTKLTDIWTLTQFGLAYERAIREIQLILAEPVLDASSSRQRSSTESLGEHASSSSGKANWEKASSTQKATNGTATGPHLSKGSEPLQKSQPLQRQHSESHHEVNRPHLRAAVSFELRQPVQVRLDLDRVSDQVQDGMCWTLCPSLVLQLSLLLFSNQSLMGQLRAGGVRIEATSTSASHRARQMLIAPFDAQAELVLQRDFGDSQSGNLDVLLQLDPIDLVLPLSFLRSTIETGIHFAENMRQQLAMRPAQQATPSISGSTQVVSGDDMAPYAEMSSLPPNTSLVFQVFSGEERGYLSVDEQGQVWGPAPFSSAARFRVVHTSHKQYPPSVILALDPSASTNRATRPEWRVLTEWHDDAPGQKSDQLVRGLRMRSITTDLVEEMGRLSGDEGTFERVESCTMEASPSIESEATDANMLDRDTRGMSATTSSIRGHPSFIRTGSRWMKRSGEQQPPPPPPPQQQQRQKLSRGSSENRQSRRSSSELQSRMRLCSWQPIVLNAAVDGILLRNEHSGRWIGRRSLGSTKLAESPPVQDSSFALELHEQATAALTVRPLEIERAERLERLHFTLRIQSQLQAKGVMIRLYQWMDDSDQHPLPLVALSAIPVEATIAAKRYPDAREQEIEAKLALQGAVDVYRFSQRRWHEILEPVLIQAQGRVRGSLPFVAFDVQLGAEQQPLRLHAYPRDVLLLSAIAEDLWHRTTPSRVPTDWCWFHNETEVTLQLQLGRAEPSEVTVHPGQSIYLYPPMDETKLALTRITELASGSRVSKSSMGPLVASIQVVGYGQLPPVPLYTTRVVQLGLVDQPSGTPLDSEPLDGTDEDTQTGVESPRSSASLSSSAAGRQVTAMPATDAQAVTMARPLKRGDATTHHESSSLTLYWTRHSDGFRDHFYLYSRIKVVNRCRSYALFLYGFLPAAALAHAQPMLSRRATLRRLGQTTASKRPSDSLRKFGSQLSQVFGRRQRPSMDRFSAASASGATITPSGEWYAFGALTQPTTGGSSTQSGGSLPPDREALQPEQAVYLGTFLRPSRIRVEFEAVHRAGDEHRLEFAISHEQHQLPSMRSLLTRPRDPARQHYDVLELGCRGGHRVATEYNIRPVLTVIHELPYRASLRLTGNNGDLLEQYALEAWGSVELCHLYGAPHLNVLSYGLPHAGAADQRLAVLQLRTVDVSSTSRQVPRMRLHCQVERHALVFRFGFYRVRLLRSETRGLILVLYAPFLLCNQVPGVSLCFTHIKEQQSGLAKSPAQLRKLGGHAGTAMQRMAGQAVAAPKRLGARLWKPGPQRASSVHPSPYPTMDTPADPTTSMDAATLLATDSQTIPPEATDGAEDVDLPLTETASDPIVVEAASNESGSDIDSTSASSADALTKTASMGSGARLLNELAKGSNVAPGGVERFQEFLVPPANLAEESALNPEAYLYCWKSLQALIRVNGASQTGRPIRLAPFGRGNKGFAVADAMPNHRLELVTEVALHSYQDRTAVLDAKLPQVRRLNLRPRFEILNGTAQILCFCDAVDWERFRTSHAKQVETGGPLAVCVVPALVPAMQQVPAATSKPGRAAVAFHNANSGRFVRFRLDETAWSGLIDLTDLNGGSVALPKTPSLPNQFWIHEYVALYSSVTMDNGRLAWTIQTSSLPNKSLQLVNRTRFDLLVKQKAKRTDRLVSLLRAATRDASQVVQAIRGATSGAANALMKANNNNNNNNNTSRSAGDHHLQIVPDTSLDNAARMIFHVPPRSERVFVWPEPLGSTKLQLKLVAALKHDGLTNVLADRNLFAEAAIVPTRRLLTKPQLISIGDQVLSLRIVAQGPERYLVLDERLTMDALDAASSEAFSTTESFARMRMALNIRLPALQLLLYNLRATPLLRLQIHWLENRLQFGLTQNQVALTLRLADLTVLNRMDRARRELVISKFHDQRETDAAPQATEPETVPDTSMDLVTVTVVLQQPTRDLLYVAVFQTAIAPIHVNVEPAILYETTMTLVSCYDQVQRCLTTSTEVAAPAAPAKDPLFSGAFCSGPVIGASSTTRPRSAASIESTDGRTRSGSLSWPSMGHVSEYKRALPAVYIQNGMIGDLQVWFTWRKSSQKIYLARMEAESNLHLAQAVQQIRELLAYVPAVRDAPIRFSGIALAEYLATGEQLIQRVFQHYLWNAIRNGYALVGSLDMLGAPLNIWGNTAGRVQAISQELARGHLSRAGKNVVNLIGGTVGDVGQSFTGALTSFGGMAWRRLRGPRRPHRDDEDFIDNSDADGPNGQDGNTDGGTWSPKEDDSGRLQRGQGSAAPVDAPGDVVTRRTQSSKSVSFWRRKWLDLTKASSSRLKNGPKSVAQGGSRRGAMQSVTGKTNLPASRTDQRVADPVQLESLTKSDRDGRNAPEEQGQLIEWRQALLGYAPEASAASTTSNPSASMRSRKSHTAVATKGNRVNQSSSTLH